MLLIENVIVKRPGIPVLTDDDTTGAVVMTTGITGATGTYAALWKEKNNKINDENSEMHTT